jgi:hypothetical protein
MNSASVHIGCFTDFRLPEDFGNHNQKDPAISESPFKNSRKRAVGRMDYC